MEEVAARRVQQRLVTALSTCAADACAAMALPIEYQYDFGVRARVRACVLGVRVVLGGGGFIDSLERPAI